MDDEFSYVRLLQSFGQCSASQSSSGGIRDRVEESLPLSIAEPKSCEEISGDVMCNNNEDTQKICNTNDSGNDNSEENEWESEDTGDETDSAREESYMLPIYDTYTDEDEEEEDSDIEYNNTENNDPPASKNVLSEAHSDNVLNQEELIPMAIKRL